MPLPRKWASIPQHESPKGHKNDSNGSLMLRGLKIFCEKFLTLPNFRKLSGHFDPKQGTPLAKKKHIITILDKFDALVNKISESLSTEITARRTQYKYYRNKLLDFKKKRK